MIDTSISASTDAPKSEGASFYWFAIARTRKFGRLGIRRRLLCCIQTGMTRVSIRVRVLIPVLLFCLWWLRIAWAGNRALRDCASPLG